jgi:hypothetical protein
VTLALALAGIVLAQLLGFSGLLRWQARQHHREACAWTQERARLVDQLCHLADRPWTPAPVSIAVREPEPEPEPFLDVDALPV